MVEKGHFYIHFIVYIFIRGKKQQNFNNDYRGKNPQGFKDESFLNIQFHAQTQL